MSQQTSAFEPAIRRLERQSAESIDEDIDLTTVVCEFDLSTVEVYETGDTEWTDRYGYEPMVRAFYCKELAGFTSTSLTPSVPARSASIPTSSLRTRLRRAGPRSVVHGVTGFPTSSRRSSRRLLSVSLGLPTNWATPWDCVLSNPKISRSHRQPRNLV